MFSFTDVFSATHIKFCEFLSDLAVESGVGNYSFIYDTVVIHPPQNIPFRLLVKKYSLMAKRTIWTQIRVSMIANQEEDPVELN